jgi:Ulp1 family protease
LTLKKATKVLECCRGAGTALDKKYSSKEKIQVLWLQQAASNGQNIQVALHKCERETIQDGKYINDNVIDFWMC